MGNRRIALMPAYEPDGKMLALIDDLIDIGFEVVVVDDGSGEEYATLFCKAENKAIVLTHESNRGKGAALKTGMKYIYKYMAYNEAVMTDGGLKSISGKDAVIVTVDADGQHLPEDALRIVEIAERNRGSLVLGGRAFTGDVPARSMMGNTITRHVYSLATGVKVGDTQTGLRAFSRDMIPDLLQIDGDRYEYEINMLLWLADEGVPIIEEEIETVYLEGNASSHFDTLRDSFKVYKEIIKFSTSSFTGFLIDYVMFAMLLAITDEAGIASALVISNVGARVVSATANYAINRSFVFRSKARVVTSALQYFLLAIIILTGNTIVLSALTTSFGINSMIAKVMTEILFFFISWTVQKYVIFFNDSGGAPGHKDKDREDRPAGSSKRNISVHAEGGR